MRKLCRFLFSRYFVSSLVILLDISLLIYLVVYASRYSVYALLSVIIINFITIFSLVNRDANPEYKVSWLVVMMLLPILGIVLYLMFYSRRLTKKQSETMRSIYSALDSFDEKNDAENQVPSERHGTFSKLKAASAMHAGTALSIFSDDAAADVYGNTEAAYFSLGESMYEAMLRDMEKAEKYIFLEYFIIEEGEMWDGIFKILKEKASLGVEVRLLYDDIGCMKTLPLHFDRQLSKLGIKCMRFSPVTPRASVAHNNRDHRKILIIDGKVAYTGGINIADEYINKKKRFGHWKDGGIRISGDAVRGFLKLFLSSWDFNLGKVTEYGKYLSEKETADKGDGGFYIPFGSGPLPIYKRSVSKNVFLNVINQASRYVYITTPYLIIDYDLTEALRGAAKRGVDVRIITPGKADKKNIKIMTKSSYSYLMESGVRIYEYLPGFIHEKILVSDDLTAVIGTINFDYRSLVHHFENAVWIYSSPVVLTVKEEFLKTVSVSGEIEEGESMLTLRERLVRNIMRIFAPLL